MEYYAAIKRNLAICGDVDRTRGYYAERNKSIREGQLSYYLPNMKNLRGNMGSLGGREEKNETRWDREGDP